MCLLRIEGLEGVRAGSTQSMYSKVRRDRLSLQRCAIILDRRVLTGAFKLSKGRPYAAQDQPQIFCGYTFGVQLICFLLSPLVRRRCDRCKGLSRPRVFVGREVSPRMS